MIFKHPGFLWLMLGFIPMVAWYIWRDRDLRAALQMSSTQSAAELPKSWRYYLRHSLLVFRIIGMAFLILALARPQTQDDDLERSVEGIDIMLSMDISGSMLARDFKPDRLEASKEVAKDFIAGRPDDRMGMVVFSGEAFTQCPLTSDHAVLLNLFDGIKSGMLKDGTAIGLGLATAVNRLKDSEAKSKVVILLTDGVNNQGAITPLTAAEIAKAFNVRVYTIGVGTEGMAPYPVQTPFGMDYQMMKVEINEDELREIANMTGGRYFRATNEDKLSDIYKEIDQLEKSKIYEVQYTIEKEEFLIFLILGLIFLLLEVGLSHTLFRTLP